MSTETSVAKKEVKPIDSVRAALEKMKPQFAMALPKHITPDRMMRVAITAIANTPKLLDCDRNSLFSAVMRAAQLGLEPDGILGQAYLIPYGNTVQFIPGYKGLIDLARRSGELSNMIAKEVCENDDFKIAWHEEVPFKHEQPTSGERGNVIGFWALARFKDGGFHWDYMTIDEAEAIRDNSSGYKAAVAWSKNEKNKNTKGQIVSPWEQNFIEMGKKTAIRRIAKYLPMSVQRATIHEELLDAGKKFTSNEFGDIIIEGEIDNESDAEDKKKTKKTSKLDDFSKENAIEHDKETGEIIESAQPALIPAKSLPGDATKTDWEGWVTKWESLVGGMQDEQSLNKLQKLNQSILLNLEKVNPPKHSHCMELFTNRMVAIGAV